MDEYPFCEDSPEDPFADPYPGCDQPGDNTMSKADFAKAPKTPAAARPRLGTYLQAGEWTPLDDLEGQEILIHSLVPITTEHGECLKGGVTDEAGETHLCCFGQVLVYPALLAFLADVESGTSSFPLAARFFKQGRTWSFE